jgi:hypothetical protein
VTDAERIAEAVRAACVEAALDAFEDASMSGLCCTGAWECAVGAVRTLDLGPVVAEAEPERPPPRRPS